MQNFLRTLIGPFDNEQWARISSERSAQEHMDASKRVCWHFTQQGTFSSAASPAWQPCPHEVCSCLQEQELCWVWCMITLHHFPPKCTRTLFTQIHPLLWAEAARGTLIYHLYSNTWSKLGCVLHGANTIPIKQTGPAHFCGDPWSLREALRLVSSFCSRTAHYLILSFISYTVWFSRVTTHTWYLN